MPLPPYPGHAGFPVIYATDGVARRHDPNGADFKNLDAAGLRIWNTAHAVDPTLGGAAYGTSAWTYQFQQNGNANSIGVPLPFPNMVGWEAYFPAYKPNATIQEVNPGEFPFDQCANYRTDGALAVADFRLRYGAYGDNDILPGTIITKAQGITNVKVNYNQEAKAFGCTSIPFPEADGMTTVTAEPPVIAPKPTPKPNTLNGTNLTDDGQPVTGGPYPGDVNGPVPQDTSSPTGGGPVQIFTGGTTAPNPGMPPRPLFDLSTLPDAAAPSAPVGAHQDDKKWLLLALFVGLFFLVRGKS